MLRLQYSNTNDEFAIKNIYGDAQSIWMTHWHLKMLQKQNIESGPFIDNIKVFCTVSGQEVDMSRGYHHMLSMMCKDSVDE